MASSLFNTKPVFLLLNYLSPWQRFGITQKKKKVEKKNGNPHTFLSTWHITWSSLPLSMACFVDLPITFGNRRVISLSFFSDCVMDTNSPTGVCVVIEQQKQQPSLWCALKGSLINGSVCLSLRWVLSERYTQMGLQHEPNRTEWWLDESWDLN